MIIAGHRRTHDTQSTTPLIFSHEESIMDFKQNGNTATSYDAFPGGMISNSSVPAIPAPANPSFDYVSSFHNFASQPPGPLALTAHQQQQQQQQRQPQHYQQQQHQNASTLVRSYVAPMTSGSTIATTSSTDYFKPPADINTRVDKDEVIVDEHHQCPGGWNEARSGQDPIINMVMMGGGGSRSNSSGSGGYPDDSLVTPCTYYSPSSAIQSSPSSDFSPPPNLFVGSNSSVAPFGRPQYIKRRRSSALAITPVHDAIVDTPQHQLHHEPVAATAAYQPSAVMPGNYYSPIPSQPSLGIQPQHQQQHYVATSGSTSTMVTPTSSATGTPSPCSFPGSASSSSSAGQPMMDQRNANMPLLRFNIILQASTAATQISEGAPTTYLNRGQAYAIHLQDTYEHDINITSTFIIMFHEPSHRKVALNYWKFWLGQQKNPPEARAVTLDQDQSVGIHNVRFPSFDRITFDWNGRYGAKIFIRFNCLSTDFSRIKGVKGIPLRAQMETKTVMNPSAPQVLANTLQSSENSNEYIEQCYCKIKLFRDKGAERKNKDDAKQIGKHLERVYAEGNPRQHPFWLMYNQPKPYSVFSEIPTTPQATDALFAAAEEQPSQIPIFPQVENSTNDHSNLSPSPEGQLATLSQPYPEQQSTQQIQHKRSFSEVDDQSSRIFDLSAAVPVSSLTLSENPTHISTTPTTTTGLSLYVNVKTTQHQRFHSPPSPTSTSRSRGDKKKLQHIILEHAAVQELIAKLCPVLSLHYSQVSEVLWRQPKSVVYDNHRNPPSSKAALVRNTNGDSALVRVDDKVLATSFANDTVVGVEWEIKSDGTVRLLLQQ